MRLLWYLPTFICVILLTEAASEPCRSSDAFFFNNNPRGSIVREGERTYLECGVSEPCDVRFQWTMDDITILNTTRRYQNGSNLVINRVNRTLDAGQFHCVATLDQVGSSPTSKISHGATLSVMWLSDNVSVVLATPKSLSDVTVNTKQVQLLCLTDGFGDIDVRWYKNGRLLDLSQRSLSSVPPRIYAEDSTYIDAETSHSPNVTLTISELLSTDSGVYSCEADDNHHAPVLSAQSFVLQLPGSLPRLRSHTTEVVAASHTSARLDCDFEAASEVQWFNKNGDRLIANSNVQILSNGSLLLLDVTNSDWFICTGISGLHNASYAVHLRIAELADFTSKTFEPSLEHYVVGQSKRFEVTCVPPRGYPKPTAYWTRQGVRIAVGPTNNRVSVNADLMLRIENAEKSGGWHDRGDAGLYACVAESIAGRKERQLELHVSVKPKIIYHPPSLNTDEGSPFVEIRCEHQSLPAPYTAVRWRKDYVFLPESHLSSPLSRFHVSKMNGSLLIHDVHLDDAGSYMCVVETMGQDPVYSTIGTLTVKQRLKFVPAAPTDKKFQVNEVRQIFCNATGSEVPRVHWLKHYENNGSEPKLSPQFPVHIRDKNGTLFFNKLKMTDAGLYTCVAGSAQGIINQTIRVDVYVFPAVVVEPKNLTVNVGEDAWLHCKASGKPPPKVEWDRGGKTMERWKDEFGVRKEQYQLFANYTLRLIKTSVHHTGNYACFAGSGGGFAREEIVLCVHDPTTNVSDCGEFGKFTQKPWNENKDDAAPSVPDTLAPHNTIAIACGAAAAYIVLVVALVVYCRMRRKKQPAEVKQLDEVNGRLLPSLDTVAPASPAKSGISASGTLRPPDLDKMEFSWSDLSNEQMLGTGIFGPVLLMQARGLAEDGTRVPNATCQVVVKKLHCHDEHVHAELAQERDMYSKLNHPNVAKLMGVLRTGGIYALMLDYLEWGNLKHYLYYSRQYRSSNSAMSVGTGGARPLTLPQIIGIAYQVAQGMEHIAAHRFVHKDVAARNVLVSPQFHAKVTSLSLSGDTFISEYYVYRHVVRPLRWMPAEALLDDDWSMKSDVWAFAVFVWELFTLGELPHQKLSNEQVLQQLTAGDARLQLPENVPEAVAEVLEQCWANNPRDRPTFEECVERIGRLHVDTRV